jgi:hypothetical protein
MISSHCPVPILGAGALLLIAKACTFGGLYDPWVPGGGDVRVISNARVVPAVMSLMGFIACCMVWFNNTVYPSEFYGPTGPEASQARAFTFLVRDQRLGASVAVAPTIYPRALSITQGRAVGITHYLLGGIVTTWAFFQARLL